MGLAVSGSIHNMSGCDVVFTTSCTAYLNSVRRAYPVMIVKAGLTAAVYLCLVFGHGQPHHGSNKNGDVLEEERHRPVK